MPSVQAGHRARSHCALDGSLPRRSGRPHGRRLPGPGQGGRLVGESGMSESDKQRDTTIRRYLQGRLRDDETARFEQSVVRDKVAQARLDALRNQSLKLRELFTFPPFDLSRVQVNVRARNPHRAVGIPPAAALLLQAAGMVAMFVLFHAMGAYIAPPDVRLERAEGRILVDSRPQPPQASGRLIMNQQVQTALGAQATLVFDQGNRVSLAGDTTVIVREPREKVRQVLELGKGEVWARFSSADGRFALIFDRGAREVAGATAEFDLATGERALLLLPENYQAPSARPVAVLRVFRGSVMAYSGERADRLVRGQWAVFEAGGNVSTGPQLGENFQLLRIDSNERFKDQLHWLNTSEFPLRAEHNVIELERRLREAAAALLEYRTRHVLRDADREIEAFEKQLTAEIQAAKARLAAGSARDPAELPPSGPLRMTDEQLAAGEEFILGAIANWRRRPNTYPSLGAAGMTLLARVQSLQEQMAELDARRAQAIVRMQEIEKLEAAMAAQDEAIKKLMESASYDPQGEKRAELTRLIEALRDTIRKATSARAEADLIRVRLGQLEDQSDELKRKRVPMQERLDRAVKLQSDIKARQKASVYTAEKLADCKAAYEAAQAEEPKADIALAGAREDEAAARKARESAQVACTSAQESLDAGRADHDQAGDSLLEAVLKRDAARRTLESAQAEVNRLQAELDKLPEGEREGSELKKQLDAAKADAAAKQGAVDEAVKAAEAAQKKVEAAAAALPGLEAALKQALESLAKAESAEQSAREAVAKAEARVTKAADTLAKTQAELAAMETAKAEWEALQKQYGEATVEYEKALWDVEDNDLAQLELGRRIEPLRSDLAAQQKIVEEAEAARVRSDELKVERDKSQAVDDDITRRSQARALLARERDAVASSQLVKDRAKMDAEFRQFSIEHGALDFTRARALEEDRQLSLKQKQALELYARAEAEAEKRMVSLLEGFCAPYRGFDLGDNEASAQTARAKIMEALWRLYYSAEGADSPDVTQAQCYYVLARSGAPGDALRALDERWRAALAEVLGKARFEEAGGLKPSSLAALAQR
ncbi:hypothetical protein EDM80_09795 [bacterium]|nr:MAG: hypothetical protein EDM80_09795 [bacterium]